MTTKRWWVIAEQFFPAIRYDRYKDMFVVLRIAFKRTQWSNSGLCKNKFHVDFEKYVVWKDRLHRDDNFSRSMWPGHLKHQRLIQDWVTIS